MPGSPPYAAAPPVRSCCGCCHGRSGLRLLARDPLSGGARGDPTCERDRTTTRGRGGRVRPELPGAQCAAKRAQRGSGDHVRVSGAASGTAAGAAPHDGRAGPGRRRTARQAGDAAQAPRPELEAGRAEGEQAGRSQGPASWRLGPLRHARHALHGGARKCAHLLGLLGAADVSRTRPALPALRERLAWRGRGQDRRLAALVRVLDPR